MYARSTNVTVQPDLIDGGIRYVEDELMPELLGFNGCIGLSLVVDRIRGQCIATSAWDTQETMRASAELMRPIRQRYIDAFGGDLPIIDEWEVSLMHRAHNARPGAYARVSWLQVPPARVDASIEEFRAILPTLEGFPGFGSASLLVNHEIGRAASTVVYDTHDAMLETRAAASDLRTAVANRGGAEIMEIAEFELAVAHLRVPELV